MGSFEKNKYKFATDEKYKLVGSEIIEARKEEVELFNEYVSEYNILLKDLTFDIPSYSVRNILINVSYFIIENIELFDYVVDNKKLPINQMISQMPITKSFLSKWSDYILIYVIILSNPDLNNLQNYLDIIESVEILGVEDVKEDKNKDKYQGIVINSKMKSALILTSKGEFKNIKLERRYELGEDAVGKIRKNIGYYKLQIVMIFALICIISGIVVLKYNTANSTLLIETTSQVRLEVNCFDRIISQNSLTEKGKLMISNLNLIDEKLDDGLDKIFQYALANDMIPRDGISITVTGKAIEYGELLKFETFVNDNKINVKFNNSGNEHKLN